MKPCQFKGGIELEEKYRPVLPCLGEFLPSSHNQKYCKNCKDAAKKWHSAQAANAAYKAEPEKFAKRTKTNRWKRAEAAGRKIRRFGQMYPCEYRDKDGKRGKGCRGKYKLTSSSQRFCENCQPLAKALIARNSRIRNIDKVKKKDHDRHKNERDVAAKVKAGLLIPAAEAAGRRRQLKEDRTYFKVGSFVEQHVARFDLLLATKRALPEHERRNELLLQRRLLKAGFSEDEIKAAAGARAPVEAARRFAFEAKNLGFNLSLSSITKYHKVFRAELQAEQSTHQG